jgi:hypothetical protein
VVLMPRWFLFPVFYGIPTYGQSDISLQCPSLTNTTIADHDRCRQKWPPSAPHEALRSTPAQHMDRQQPPEQADIILGAVKGVYGTQNTPMLWRFIIAGTKECFEGHTHPHPPPKKLHLLAWGIVTYLFEVSAQSAKPHVGR